MTEKKNKSAIQRRLIPTYIFLIIVSFISVFPLYWMISAATNTSTDVSRGRILPGTYFMQNFKNLTAQQPLWRALGNSLFLCSSYYSDLPSDLFYRRLWL